MKPNLQDPGALMKVPEVRNELRVGLTTVYRLIASNCLEKVKIGAATRITRKSVERLIAEASKTGADQ